MLHQTFTDRGYAIDVFFVFRDLDGSGYTGLSVRVTAADNFSRRVDRETKANLVEYTMNEMEAPREAADEEIVMNMGFKMGVAEVQNRIDGLDG